MNKIEWHTLVSIPSQLLDEVHQMYKLQEMNHGEWNEKKLRIVQIYTEHVWELVCWILHKHYLDNGKKDIS